MIYTEATRESSLFSLILLILLVIGSSRNDEKSIIPPAMETSAWENGITAANKKSDAKNQEKSDLI